MTFARLLADLQDAWRQAMADGPRGTGQRGWFEVRRDRGTVRVILLVSVERGHRCAAAADVSPDAEVLEIWGPVDVVSELLRVSARHFRTVTEEALGEIATAPGGGEALFFRCGGFVRL